MIQTLILANSLHRTHSQISMRTLSLSLFHQFVEIRACGLQRTSPDVFSGWRWYPRLLLKIVISLKNSFTTVCSWKKKKSFCCLRTQIREIWFHCLYIHSKLNQTPQLSTLQLNQRFSNAIHFTINLWLWHLKSASHVYDVIVKRDVLHLSISVRCN